MAVALNVLRDDADADMQRATEAFQTAWNDHVVTDTDTIIYHGIRALYGILVCIERNTRRS